MLLLEHVAADHGHEERVDADKVGQRAEPAARVVQVKHVGTEGADRAGEAEEAPERSDRSLWKGRRMRLERGLQDRADGDEVDIVARAKESFSPGDTVGRATVRHEADA